MRDVVIVGGKRFLTCRCDLHNLFQQLPNDPLTYCKLHGINSFCQLCLKAIKK